VGTAAACRSLGVSGRRSTGVGSPRRPQSRPRHGHAAAGTELAGAAAVVDVLHRESFADKAPRVYATLLDQGNTSARSAPCTHPGRPTGSPRATRPTATPTYHKPQLLATAPTRFGRGHHQALGPAKWIYFHLYVILDIFSRYVVGWMLASRESDTWRAVDRETVIKEGSRGTVDDPQRSRPSMRCRRCPTPGYAGITKSTAAHVSDDNPFSRASSRVQVPAGVPDRFASIEHGLDFCGKFFHCRTTSTTTGAWAC